MSNHYSTDNPVNTQDQDKFQRYPFSKHIADTIIARGTTNQECLVIGIYGAWGEGKSSVLEFISKELNEKAILLKFNPWRYKNEDELLKSFLKNIANTLNKPLNNNKEKLGDLIEKYGNVGSFFGFDPSKLGEKLAEVDLETLKERVDNFLKAIDKQLVIIIDDIDRLDKQEIYAIFRLVKLTGSFTNTTYILSFDENMVAAAIGERFENGNVQAGFNFLEKIIQVPLKIPKAQPVALKKYCFNLIEQILQTNQISLNDEEKQRFKSKFYHILPKLTTPRLAIRYSNSFAFSSALLKNEVNMVDLLLIEAIKIMYPEHYEFIKQHGHYFVKGRDKTYAEALKKLTDTLKPHEKRGIEALIADLFPLTLKDEEKNTDYWVYEMEQIKSDLTKNKRIGGSLKYFDRYFAYTVIRGQIGDIVFEDLINDILKENNDEKIIANQIRNLIEEDKEYQYDLAEDLVVKFKLADLSLFENSQKVKIIKALALCDDILPTQTNNFLGVFKLPFNPTYDFTYDLLITFDNQVEILKEILEAKTYKKASDFFSYFLSKNKDQNNSIEISPNLMDIILQKALKSAEARMVFEVYPEDTQDLIKIWYHTNKTKLEEYIVRFIEENPNNIFVLLRGLTSVFDNFNIQKKYLTNFGKSNYQFLKDSLSIDYFYEKVNQYFQQEIVEEAQFFDEFENKQTDLNILRQFVFWYEEDHSSNTTT